MKSRSLPSRLAAVATAGALLTTAFASGCQTHQSPPPPSPAPAPDHSKDGKDGPVVHHRHHRQHHREMAPQPVGAPAPITHPGG